MRHAAVQCVCVCVLHDCSIVDKRSRLMTGAAAVGNTARGGPGLVQGARTDTWTATFRGRGSAGSPARRRHQSHLSDPLISTNKDRSSPSRPCGEQTAKHNNCARRLPSACGQCAERGLCVLCSGTAPPRPPRRLLSFFFCSCCPATRPPVCQRCAAAIFD